MAKGHSSHYALSFSEGFPNHPQASHEIRPCIAIPKTIQFGLAYTKNVQQIRFL